MWNVSPIFWISSKSVQNSSLEVNKQGKRATYENGHKKQVLDIEFQACLIV